MLCVWVWILCFVCGCGFLIMARSKGQTGHMHRFSQLFAENVCFVEFSLVSMHCLNCITVLAVLSVSRCLFRKWSKAVAI